MDEFHVIDESEVMDLSELKQTRVVVPATQNVLFAITGATVRKGQAKDASGMDVVFGEWLRVTFRLVDGIGEEGKWAGKVFDQDFQTWAHPSKKEKSDWYKNDQHLIQYKLLCQALGQDLKTIPVHPGENFISSMIGREVMGNITVESERAKNPETGTYEATGEMANRIKNLKPVPEL